MEKSSNATKMFFPYGVAYYRPPTPLQKYWEKDLRNIRESGLNMIRVSCFWSWIEKDEGRFDFTEFDLLSDLARKNGLKIIFTLYMVCSPEWIFEKYPDSKFVSANGIAIESDTTPDAAAGGYPGLCFDSDKVREKGEIFIREITKHYKNDETVLGFDIMHEPTEEPTHIYYPESWKERMFCYCPHSIERFRRWLEGKYGSLEGLNQNWQRRYSRWSQVQPPRAFGVYTDWLDWRSFAIDALEDELKWVAGIIRANDENRFTTCHHALWELSPPFIAASDMYKFSKTVDVYGASVYDVEKPSLVAASCDILRSFSKNGDFWIGETSGGSGPMFSFIGEKKKDIYAFAKEMSKDQIAKHIWGTIAHGAKGIVYWMWRPEIYTCETAAMGLTDREGNLTERVEAASQISNVINKETDLFIHGKSQRGEVAIMFSIDSFLQDGMISLFKTRGKEMKNLDSLINAYSVFWRENVALDFVSKEQVMLGALKKYKLLVMPYVNNVTSELGEKIREFVREGGTVFSDALCGYFTEGGWGCERAPGAGLDEVFNCNVVKYYMEDESEVMLQESKAAYLSAKGRIAGKNIREILEVYEGGKIVGKYKDGAPTAVLGKYGLGSALYIGTQIFLKPENTELSGMYALVKGLLRIAGVQPRFKVNGRKKETGVEVRILVRGSEGLLFVVNHRETAENVKITAKGLGKIDGLFDLIKGEKLKFKQAANSLTIDLRLTALEVRVFKVKGAADISA
jgi:beta-galactosidase GanA